MRSAETAWVPTIFTTVRPKHRPHVMFYSAALESATVRHGERHQQQESPRGRGFPVAGVGEDLRRLCERTRANCRAAKGISG